MRETCPFANERCKYFRRLPPPELAETQDHGCYADTSHPFFPRKLVAQLGRAAVLMNRDLAKSECRAEHDAIHARDKWNLPTNQEVREWQNGTA